MIYTISRIIFTFIVKLLLKCRISGREHIPEPPFILASNHGSVIDPALVGIACNKYHVDFMAKKEIMDKGFLGAWTKKVNCIEVRRGENSVRSLKEAIRRLKKGHVIGVFPEGTRSLDGSLQDAKRGTGFIISKASVPVVPVYIKGSMEALPKDQKMKCGTAISIVLGKPIFPEEFGLGSEKGPGYDEISSKVMARIAELKEKTEKSEKDIS